MKMNENIVKKLATATDMCSSKDNLMCIYSRSGQEQVQLTMNGNSKDLAQAILSSAVGNEDVEKLILWVAKSLMERTASMN